VRDSQVATMSFHLRFLLGGGVFDLRAVVLRMPVRKTSVIQNCLPYLGQSGRAGLNRP